MAFARYHLRTERVVDDCPAASLAKLKQLFVAVEPRVAKAGQSAQILSHSSSLPSQDTRPKRWWYSSPVDAMQAVTGGKSSGEG